MNRWMNLLDGMATCFLDHRNGSCDHSSAVPPPLPIGSWTDSTWRSFSRATCSSWIAPLRP